MTGPKLRARMSYAEAVARIPERPIPGFWVGDPVQLDALAAEVTRGQVTELARSPGDRALWLVAYGAAEPLLRQANFNSAVGGREPAAFLDKDRREKPVVLLIGPVHGQETEGLTGLVNLIAVLETGFDRRGKSQSALRELGERCRLLIVPCGNPDGVARFKPQLLNGMGHDDVRFWGQGSTADDTLWGWPGCKQRHPMVGPDVGFLGCYFNDEGVNPMHDEWFAPMGPEAAALLDLARDEGPDLAVSLHSHQAPPALLRPAYVPLEVQAEGAALAEATYTRLEALGLKHAQPFEPRADQGVVPPAFNLISAIYHTSGASAFTFECPHGLQDVDAYRVAPEAILDIQLMLYTALLTYALADH